MKRAEPRFFFLRKWQWNGPLIYYTKAEKGGLWSSRNWEVNPFALCTFSVIFLVLNYEPCAGLLYKITIKHIYCVTQCGLVQWVKPPHIEALGRQKESFVKAAQRETGRLCPCLCHQIWGQCKLSLSLYLVLPTDFRKGYHLLRTWVTILANKYKTHKSMLIPNELPI